MKALIAPQEISTWRWISSWQNEKGTFLPVYSEIQDCQRVAEVATDSGVFEIAPPLFWVNCADSCTADAWYFKDGQLHEKPTDEPIPSAPIEELP